MHITCRSQWSLKRAGTWPTVSAPWATWSARPRPRTGCGRCLRWPPEQPCRSASARTGGAASCCEGTDCGPISSSHPLVILLTLHLLLLLPPPGNNLKIYGFREPHLLHECCLKAKHISLSGKQTNTQLLTVFCCFYYFTQSAWRTHPFLLYECMFFVFICAYFWQIHLQVLWPVSLSALSVYRSSCPSDFFLFFSSSHAAHSSTPIIAHLFFCLSLSCILFFFSPSTFYLP